MLRMMITFLLEALKMGGVKALRKLESDNPELNKVQEYVQQSIAPITKSVIINGTLLKNIKLLTGQANNINHKLDRNISGFIIVRKRATADIWDEQDANELKKKTLRLQTSANVTVDIWVF